LLRKIAPALILPAMTVGILVGIRSISEDTGGNAPVRAAPPGGGGAVTVPDRSSTSTCNRPNALIGTAAAHRVVARTEPDPGAKVIATFGRRTEQRGPQVFLLQQRLQGPANGVWFKALLPIRPNGTRGYIRADSLRLSQTPYRIVVNRKALSLTLWEGCRRVKTYRIGLGTKYTPTPVGKFYLASLIKPINPDSIYGSFAYGLSGYSPVIKNWTWGGIIGIHGTNNPSSVGKRISHGCIRMRNRQIAALVKILPLGTPVEIR
jgi:lipoprotein-anchoring transpeptidase ErfK/SrfK